jgi:glucosylceramidase
MVNRKIIIMKKIAVPFLMLVTHSAVVKAQQTGTKRSYKTITVYTTADKTDYRLSKTNTLTLAPFGQPLETQPRVFLDATRKFQTITGIGGPIKITPVAITKESLSKAGLLLSIIKV